MRFSTVWVNWVFWIGNNRYDFVAVVAVVVQMWFHCLIEVNLGIVKDYMYSKYENWIYKFGKCKVYSQPSRWHELDGV